MKKKITCLFLSLFMIISYIPASVLTSYALPVGDIEINDEETNPKLVLDEKFDKDDVFIYKILDGSEFQEDSFGLISYSDTLNEDISEEYLEVDKFYSNLLELFEDIKFLEEDTNKFDLSTDEDSNKEDLEEEKEEITQEDINSMTLKLYGEILKYIDKSKKLQFNDDNEFEDLTEGVFLICSKEDKYYPQFINVTDSSEDILITLEENKEVTNGELEVTPEAKLSNNEEVDSNKKQVRSTKSGSSVISKFNASIISGAELKTIGDNEVLVIDIKDKYNTKTDLANSPIMYNVNFTLSGTENFPVGSVSFTIPDHIFKDRFGNYVDTVAMPILEAPATNNKNFNYVYDEDNGVYIITNTAELDSAYSATFSFGYIINDTYPTDIIDGILNNNTINSAGASDSIETTLTVNDTTDTKTVNPVYIDTEVPNYYSSINSNPTFYKTWPSNWGDAPSDADDYYYLELRWCPALNYSTQYVNVEYTVNGLNNSGELFKMHWAPISEYSYNNYGCFSNDSSIQNTTTLTGTNLDINLVNSKYYYSSPQAQTTYALIRYPKSVLDDGEVHTLSYNKSFSWSGYYDTSNIKNRDISGSITYQKKDFEPPTGNIFSISKNYGGNYNKDGLNYLLNNKNYTLTDFYTNFTTNGFIHTLKDGGNPNDIDDYGYKKYHNVLIDDSFYIINSDNKNYTRLTEDNYYINKVQLNFYIYNYEEKNGSYQYVSTTLNEPLNYTLYGKTTINGEWIELGHSQVNSETNNPEFIWADGTITNITSSNKNSITLTLEGKNIVGLKLDTETNSASIETYMRCYMTYKPSDIYESLLDESSNLLFTDISSGYLITPNGEFKSYDNSSSALNSIYLSTEFKNEISNSDNNQYNEKIMHAYNGFKLNKNYYYVSQGYNNHTFTNDIDNSQVNCNYSLYSYEYPEGDSGNTQLYQEGIVRSQTEGTFYNLLPLGFNIDESTINVRTHNYVSDVVYTYELKPNWQDSGRTMLVVNCQTTEDVYNRGFYLDYSGYYSWNSISDYGKTLNNTFAYKTGNDEYGGASTTYPDNGGNLNSELKTLFTDVDEDGETTGNHRFYYSTVNDSLEVPTIASVSLEKSVKSNNSSNYISGENNTEVVTAGENYSYQIHWGTDDDSHLSNMVLYDVLESYKPSGVSENWQGIFDSIDLSSPKINGINPVVYYSTQSIDVNSDRDLTSSKWTTTIPEDKSQIKAIAVDLSKDSNNNDFVLDENKTISIIINMKAPYNNAKYLEENNIKAYNSVYLANTLSTNVGSSTNNFDNYEYTEIGIKTDKVKVSGSKRWIDLDDSERTNSVNISLYQNSTKIDTQTVSADTNWNYSFNNLQKYDNSGNEYTYTVDEETNIDNYKKVIKPIDEKGLLIHFDDSTEGSTSYINLYYINNGQYYKSNNLIYDNIKGKTVYVPAETVTIYSKTYGGNSYKVDNIDIIDRNNKLADIIPTYSSSSLSTNPSYIFRGLDYPHYEGDTLITSTNTYVRYIPENIVSYNIYNVLDKTSVKVKKEWLDYNNSANTRPSNISVKLLQNGNELNTYSITGPTWEKEISGLDAYDDNLQPYQYKVEENSIENYTSTIKTDNAIKITFSNNSNTYNSSDYVQLYYERDGQIYKYIGSGSNGSGNFYGSSSYSLANKTIYLPGTKAYIYWYTNGNTTSTGWDITEISTDKIELPTTETTSTLPSVNPINVTTNSLSPDRDETGNYLNNEKVLWEIDKSDSLNFEDKIVISNKGLLRNISGTKSWNNDTEANRPERVIVNLLRNGEKVDEQAITASNNWEYEFENLLVYDSNNEKYQYSISEDAVEGYSTLYSNGTDTVSVPTEGYYNIENTWNPRTITITKQWTNTKGGDDSEFRPENITVHLVKKPTVRLFLKNLLGNNNTTTDYRYETENEYVTDNTKWVKNGNTWTYTFAIPANNYDWQVYEDELDYYNESNLENNPANVTEDAVIITNDYDPHIRIKGEKIWPEGDESYRPGSITVNLLRNNQIIATKNVTAEDNWKYDFGYYPVYDSNNNEYNYSLSENQLDDYISTIDDISIGYSSYAITFGDQFATESTSFDWVSIYYVDEDNNLRLLTGQDSNNGKWGGSNSNSLAGKTIYVPSNVFYVYWRSDRSNVDYGFDVDSITPANIPDDIIITSTTVTSLPVSESNAISITDTNLPGTTHNYTNNEIKLWKYEGVAGANDFNITNILNKQSISGTKTWLNDSEENRPANITVNLYQDGTKIAETTTNASKNWVYTFEGMPIYKDNGKTLYEYYVTEEPVENYYTHKPIKGTAITFGNNFNTYNNYDYLKILYVDENNNLKWLIGQGTNTSGTAMGLFYGGSGAPCPKGKTIYVPSNKVYLYWETNNSGTAYGFDIISMVESDIPSDITINSQDTTLPEYTPIKVTDNSLPATTHNYSNNEHKLWYYERSLNSLGITNEWNIKDIKGTVNWSGEGDSPEKRPQKVTLKLYQSSDNTRGTALYATQELTIDENSTQPFEFKNVPIKDDNGSSYTYIVEQDSINNYRTSNIDELNILNEASLRDVTGYKVWVNDEGRNSRPESIKVILYDENNVKIAEKLVTSADEFRENCWKYTFENVDVFDNNGNYKYYHVKEEIDTQEYYTGYIPNHWYKYSTENNYLVNSSAQEIWENREELPSYLYDELFDSWFNYLNNNSISWEIGTWDQLSSDYQNLFTEWFNNYRDELLDNYFDDNHLYGYNYETSTQKKGVELSNIELTSIVNVYRLKHIEGIKYWEDEGSQYTRPDSVTIGLYRNGEKIDEQLITADGNWEYSFVNLPEVDSEGNLYDYDIREEGLNNYITEYNPADVTEGVQVTFKLPSSSSDGNYFPKYGTSNSIWNQNNVYDNYSTKYGLVTIFKDGNTWYKMTLEEYKDSYNPTNKSITFTIPSREFYIIPVFIDYSGNNIVNMREVVNEEEFPSLVSYKKVQLNDLDRAKLNYVRSVSRVEFPASYSTDTFDYHMYNGNEYGILFEKLGSSFNINDEVEHVIELTSAELPDYLDEYVTAKTRTESYIDDNDEEVSYEVTYERWIHNVAYHYNERPGLTNYPYDAKTSYSGTKIWNNNIEEQDADDSPNCFGSGSVEVAMSKLVVKAATQVTQPDSVTVVLLQDGQPYDTQTIGEDTDWKFNFNDLPMFNPDDHHKYEYSIKEKSIKGYKSEVFTPEETNGHQVIISSDIPMNLYQSLRVYAQYEGEWYDLDWGSLPGSSYYSKINNKLKLYIPGDDFKILVQNDVYTQNNISQLVQDAQSNGVNITNYIKLDSIKAVNIPYTINHNGDTIYYKTSNMWGYYWYETELPTESNLPEGYTYNTTNLSDGDVQVVTLNDILQGYDSTNSDEQYSKVYNIYEYTSKVTSGILIKNTYYEGSFKVKKVDERGRILPGCEFSLYYADGITWTKLENDPTAISISDSNGMVSFENIPYGDYLLYETKPADGYRTPSKPWKVSINTNGSASVWDENGKLVPIQGSEKEYDMTNGVRLTYNADTDIPYDYLYIVAKDETNNSAIIYTKHSNSPNSSWSSQSIDIPSKDFYIIFYNYNSGSRSSQKSVIDSKSLLSKAALGLSSSSLNPYGFKVESIEPIETSWDILWNSNNYRYDYNSIDDGITWDEYLNNSSEFINIIECSSYPESDHYEDFVSNILYSDKNTAWHYDASNINSDSDKYDNDALFEGNIITFGNNNHASSHSITDSETGDVTTYESYYNPPILLYEYEHEYYAISLPNDPAELNNLSIKVPSNNIWIYTSGKYQQDQLLKSSTVPSEGSYEYDLGNEKIDVQSITKSLMTKDDVSETLNMSIDTDNIPTFVFGGELDFNPEFELTSGPQEINWFTDVLGENDAATNTYYEAYYHFENDASGLIPIYEIANELTRTETILVNTGDEPIPGGVLQIIDKDGNIVDSWETTDVNHVTLGLTEGEEYTIHQVSTPYPYIVAEDDTFTVKVSETTYVKVINDKASDVTISKTVSGNGGNTNDTFSYHLVISGGHPNVTHTVQMSNGNNTTVTTDANGNATLDFTLKHNETAKVVGVFKDTNITVTESANNYVASYKIGNNSRVINDSNLKDLTASTTMSDDDIVIAYENTITLIVPTSAYLKLKDMLPYVLLGICLAGMVVIYRKNRAKKLSLIK